MTVAIVDYGIGNLGSVAKAFRHLGVRTELTADPRALGDAEALVLPGDGAFGATMDEIAARGLEGPLREAVAAGKPLLGICIGMQVLFEDSTEHGHHRGLALLPGHVWRLDVSYPVPHMGWNRLVRGRDHPLLDGVADGVHVYFVHSYFCDAPAEVVVATTDYGIAFPAVVARDNVMGMQFHPEKSQSVGLQILGNFVRAFVPSAASAAAGRAARVVR